MRDPFPIPPPESLVRLVQPVADVLGFPTLPLHAHEAVFAFFLYTFVCCVVSPIGSNLLCPKIYKKLNKRTRVNWDVHVTSFVQSTVISIFSLYVIFYDEERKEARAGANWESRIWEYTGLSGLCQSFAFGYFFWDLIMCLWRVDIFGWGMVAHAVSALTVFSFGYRPFVGFYAPVFLLYELSSPFLNIHWFCDKLELTGSTIQAVNGALLTTTFFGCRLIWGNLSSIFVFMDIFRGVRTGNLMFTGLNLGAAGQKSFSAADLIAISQDAQAQRWAFAGEPYIPVWLAFVYLASNLTLNSLNIFWFGKMIETIRKRFDPPFGTKGIGADTVHWEPQEKTAAAVVHAVEGDVAVTAQDHETLREAAGKPKKSGSVRAAREKAEAALDRPIVASATDAQRAAFANGASKSVEVSGTRSVRSRRA